MRNKKLVARINNSKIDELKSKVFSTLESLNIFEKECKLGVAVSGGADSLALALLVNEWAKLKGGRVYAITIDHGLRGESETEALMAKKWLENRGIKHKIIRLNIDKKKNIAKRARDERYKELMNFCYEEEIYDLFLGHNLDDQAENFLIRSIRGSGIKGLAAIEPIIYKDKLRIIRPLLAFFRSEIVTILTDYRQEWVEDPSNKDENFLRPKVRNFFVNQNFSEIGLLKRRFAENSLKLLLAEESLSDQILDFIFRHIKIKSKNVFLVNKREFLFLGKYLSVKFLKKILTILGEKEYGPRIRGVEKAYGFLLKNSAKGKILINNCLVETENERFFSVSRQKTFN